MNHILAMSLWMFLVGYFAISLILPANTPFHLNKVYMALQMVGFMMIFSFFMSGQYAFAIGAILITAIITYLLRNQIGISETQFLRGMTEHHQMALLMASKILEKPVSQFTRTLANNILTSQHKEIDDMNAFLQ